MKTKHEKDADKVAKMVARALGPPLSEFMEYKIDTTAMIAFKPLSDLLKRKRIEIHNDFKGFCKSHGFTQHKIKGFSKLKKYLCDLVFFKCIFRVNATGHIYPGPRDMHGFLILHVLLSSGQCRRPSVSLLS